MPIGDRGVGALLALVILCPAPTNLQHEEGSFEDERRFGQVILEDTNSTNFMGVDNSTQSTYIEKLIQEYEEFATLLMSLSKNETNLLASLPFEELKRKLDELCENNVGGDRAPTNQTLLLLLQNEENFTNILQNYHRATIYATIRSLWNAKLAPLLPPIDQIAILDYFEQRKTEEERRTSFLTRLWRAIRTLFSEESTSECDASQPSCIRTILDTMPRESRKPLGEALLNDDPATVRSLIDSQEVPLSVKEELEEWEREIEPPQPLLHIIRNATPSQRDAIERLRQMELTHALQDYYRAMIERRSSKEQEEIRIFFHTMNDTFARCYNPLRDKYEYWKSEDTVK